VAAACSATAPSGPAEPSASTSTDPGAVTSTEPSSAPEPSVETSSAPSVEPSVAASVEGSGQPSQYPATGPAAGCTGNDDNKNFYAKVAAAVEWTVYCPVLPARWFVDTGNYSAAGGGVMTIGYRGPGGTTFALREGHWCSDGADVCAPRDTVIGPAAFGDREGELGTLSGGFVIHVDRGAGPTWEATVSGIDEETFRAYAEALIPVSG
jgi:hypothetical protein